MTRFKDVRTLIIGATIAMMIYGIFVALIGLREFHATLIAIPLSVLSVMLLTALGGLIAMGGSFYAITRSIGLDLHPIEAIILFTGINLAHNLTPFGQAGGEPLGAWFISQRSERPYEQCLAAVSALDVINFVPALLVFTVGGAYIVILEPTIPPEIRVILAIFTILVIGITTAILAIITYPDRPRVFMHVLAVSINRFLNRIHSRLSLPSIELQERVDTYMDSLGDVARDQRTVLVSSALSTTAFAAQGMLLWLGMLAVGEPISLILAVFIVPVSLMASVIPLPGGGGGIEATQILLLVVSLDVSLALTAMAVILSRGIVYWLPVLLGSITAGAIVVKHRHHTH